METHKKHDPFCASRVWVIIEAALAYFISLLVTGAYLARITSNLGFSDSLTGILSSFVSLGCIFQLGSISLFRRFHRVKRPILLIHLINEGLFALIYLIPVFSLDSGQKTALFLLCFCGSYILANLLTPQKTSWFMSLVDDRARGIFTAKKEIVSLLGGMVFTYVMGVAVDSLEARGDQRAAFILGAIVILVLTFFQLLSVARIQEKTSPRPVTHALQDVKALLRDRMLMKIILTCILWHVAAGVATPFYGAYQIKELGFSMTFISIHTAAYSVVRVLFSPWMGRYADRHSFSRMVALCFTIAAASFLVNCFTVPENGKVLYFIHHCLYAVAMAGINSALTNLIFDYVKDDRQRGALALNAAAGGVAGFGATCLMSPLVSLIQQNGNQFLGLPVYAAQFVSAVAFLVTAFLVFYVRRFVIGRS